GAVQLPHQDEGDRGEQAAASGLEPVDEAGQASDRVGAAAQALGEGDEALAVAGGLALEAGEQVGDDVELAARAGHGGGDRGGGRTQPPDHDDLDHGDDDDRDEPGR